MMMIWWWYDKDMMTQRCFKEQHICVDNEIGSILVRNYNPPVTQCYCFKMMMIWWWYDDKKVLRGTISLHYGGSCRNKVKNSQRWQIHAPPVFNESGPNFKWWCINMQIFEEEKIQFPNLWKMVLKIAKTLVERCNGFDGLFRSTMWWYDIYQYV